MYRGREHEREREAQRVRARVREWPREGPWRGEPNETRFMYETRNCAEVERLTGSCIMNYRNLYIQLFFSTSSFHLLSQRIDFFVRFGCFSHGFFFFSAETKLNINYICTITIIKTIRIIKSVMITYLFIWLVDGQIVLLLFTQIISNHTIQSTLVSLFKQNKINTHACTRYTVYKSKLSNFNDYNYCDNNNDNNNKLQKLIP